VEAPLTAIKASSLLWVCDKLCTSGFRDFLWNTKK